VTATFTVTPITDLTMTTVGAGTVTNNPTGSTLPTERRDIDCHTGNRLDIHQLGGGGCNGTGTCAVTMTPTPP
jgi:hypothetical protein